MIDSIKTCLPNFSTHQILYTNLNEQQQKQKQTTTTTTHNNNNNNNNNNHNHNHNQQQQPQPQPQPTTTTTKQPNNQTTKQPNNQTTKQPTNQPTNQPNKQTTNNKQRFGPLWARADMLTFYSYLQPRVVIWHFPIFLGIASNLRHRFIDLLTYWFSCLTIIHLYIYSRKPNPLPPLLPTHDTPKDAEHLAPASSSAAVAPQKRREWFVLRNREETWPAREDVTTWHHACVSVPPHTPHPPHPPCSPPQK